MTESIRPQIKPAPIPSEPIFFREAEAQEFSADVEALPSVAP